MLGVKCPWKVLQVENILLTLKPNIGSDVHRYL